MTDWREELIEQMAERIKIMRLFIRTDADIARAALAVAEPVIRERCAEMAEKSLGTWGAANALYIAAAIREGRMVDILERLQSQRTSLGTLWPEPNLHEEAAEKIIQLREELAAVTERMSKLDFERTAAELERDALREENARLREVLKPFVKTLEWNCTDADPDDACIDHEGALSIGDLRAARAAIGEGGKDDAA